jgi:hypothetical protein
MKTVYLAMAERLRGQLLVAAPDFECPIARYDVGVILAVKSPPVAGFTHLFLFHVWRVGEIGNMNGTGILPTDPAPMEPILREENNRELEDIAFDRSLGGSICGLAGQSLDVGNGGREDDSAASVDQWRELLDREKRSLGVQVEHLVVDGRGHVLERRWNAEPGADGEQVEGAEFGLHPRGEGFDVRQRTRVARNHDGVLANLVLGRIQAGLRETGYQYARPPSMSIFAVASPMPLVPPIITTFLA